MGKELKVEDQEAMLRGRLLENTILGNDRGTLSTKVLGSDRRAAMWQGKSQIGLVVLQAPPVPRIAHEVPLIEPRRKQEEESEG